MTVSASRLLATCAAAALLAVGLSGCGGGGGSGPVMDEAVVDPLPEPVPGLESAVERAADAFFRAGVSATDAVAACAADTAACDASDDALAALDRASAAYNAAEAATTLADAEQAALAAELAAEDAAAAAAIAQDLAASVVDPQPLPEPDPGVCALDDPPEYCEASTDPPPEVIQRYEAAYAAAVHASDAAAFSAYEADKACEANAAACDAAALAAIAAEGAAIAAEAVALARTVEQAERAAADAVQAAMDAADAAAVAKSIAMIDPIQPDPMPEPEPTPGTGWSDSPWVAIIDTYPSISGPGTWIGSKYQLQLSNSTEPPSIGEVGSFFDCFSRVSIFTDCVDDNDGVDTIEYVVTDGVIHYIGGDPHYFTEEIDIVWARGRLDIRGNEQAAGFFGFTELGYWAVGWTEEAGKAYTTHGDFVSPAFSTPTHFAIEYGQIEDYRNPPWNLQRLPNNQTWSTGYAGFMTGIAHQHGNSPVIGDVSLKAEFADDYWLNSMQLTVFDIKGDGFVLPDIEFPIVDGNCCDEKKPNGSIAIASFELDYGGMYLEGEFAGIPHKEVHGAFSTYDVSGAFGAIESGDYQPLPQ